MNLLKNISKRKLLVACFVVPPLILLYHFILKSPVQSDPVPAIVHPATLQKTIEVSFGFPVRLKIPRIKVDAAIDNVGLTPEGELGSPTNPDNAGWYDQGPRPGEEGSSVIDGHFGYKDNVPAIFDNLHTLQEGDMLFVEDERGTTLTFVVRKLQIYKQNDNYSDVLASIDGKAHLNLITCAGDWNKELKSYSTRLVVFADKEE